MTPPSSGELEEVRQRAERFGQGHIFSWWPELNETQRKNLINQAASIDFPLVHNLAKELIAGFEEPPMADLTPAPILPIPRTDTEKTRSREARDLGETMLREGTVAPLVVAGGQGTRLGFSGPKGAFPITPISNKCLFAVFAEKIIASQKRYGPSVPWFIMTSPANREETISIFRAHNFFGLTEEQVLFFVQGTLPAVNPQGEILMAAKDQIALSPDGHGGTLRALVSSCSLDRMEALGITDISYFQVDNVLVKVLDPVFIGHHAMAGADMSSKVVSKDFPEEKVGVVGMRDGHLGVIEYSDLGKEDMFAKGPDGRLKYWAGSIAIHMLRVGFIRRLCSEKILLPFHRAVKKVRSIDDQGNRLTPESPNGIKFESFIFDALEYAANPVTMEVARQEEFSPVKNATGLASPETARHDLMELFASWLEEAGVTVPRGPDGSLSAKIEISPLLALDRREAREKLKGLSPVSDDLYLSS